MTESSFSQWHHLRRVQSELENVPTGCTIEALVDLCPDLTWNQIFLAIDHLSRSGLIRLTRGCGRDYWVQAIVRPNLKAVLLHTPQTIVDS